MRSTEARNLLETRIQLAIYRYQNEDLSLAKAAELAGVSWARMRDILREKGINAQVGARDDRRSREGGWSSSGLLGQLSVTRA